MPIHLRRRFFYVLIAVFLVLGTGAVFYAQGWRPGGSGPFGFEKVGGIYVRTFPTDAAITVDGRPEERSFGIFDRGTLLSDLLPGPHTLAASATGFEPWRRQVAIQSSFVVRLEYVTLVPSDAEAATTTSVQAVDMAGSAVVLKTAEGLRTLAGGRIEGDEVLAASEDGSVIISHSTATHSYLVTSLDQATTSILRGLGVQASAGGGAGLSFQPVPGDNTLFLLRTPSYLGLLRTSTGELTQLATSTVIAAVVPGRVAWADYDAKTRTSLLSFYDTGPRAAGRNVDSVPGHVTAMAARDAGEIFFLTDDGSLYSLDLGQSSRTRLAQGVRSLFLSPDGDELAALDGQGVRIFFLRSEQPQAALALPDAGQVRRLTWYRDGEHLFVEYPDHVSFLELDDPELQNFATVAATADAEYQREANVLYFVKDGALFKKAFPSP